MFIIGFVDDQDVLSIGSQPYDDFDKAESDVYNILEENGSNSELFEAIYIYEINEVAPLNEYYWQIQKE